MPNTQKAITLRLPNKLFNELAKYQADHGLSSYNEAGIQLIRKGLTNSRLEHLKTIDEELRLLVISIEGLSKSNTNIEAGLSDIMTAIYQTQPEIKQYQHDNQKGSSE